MAEVIRVTRLPVVHREPDSKVSMEADHRTTVAHIAEEAARMAAAALRVSQAAEQVLHQTGGQVLFQPQVTFLVGSLARLQKDWAVCDHLQTRGAKQRRPVDTRR